MQTELIRGFESLSPGQLPLRLSYDEAMRNGLILGIETSCDETAAAVVREGREVLSNVVASQMALHANYGGVVPELASREHLRNIVPIVRQAISQADVTFADLDAVAVTEGPGLAGALLVGITFAKALSYGIDRPLIAVNHLEGHIHAVLMQAGAAISSPLIALVVSGGHTHLYLATQPDESPDRVPHVSPLRHGLPPIWTYRNIGRTVDDAAGEAFDKVAKLLGLGYPGGPWIDGLAAFGDPTAVEFRFGEIKPRTGAPASERRFDFSFSGIKTAVLRYVETHSMRDRIAERRSLLAAAPGRSVPEVATLCTPQTLGLIASFQAAVVGNLLRQAFAAAEAFGASGIVVSGGVAANGELRHRFLAEGERRSIAVAFPSIAMSTDNAAMIAAAAWPRLLAADFASEGMAATPALRLG